MMEFAIALVQFIMTLCMLIVPLAILFTGLRLLKWIFPFKPNPRTRY